jgi:DNA-binding response OmpR family regulator
MEVSRVTSPRERAITRCALAVDDEVDFLATYRRVLAREGYAVIAASTVRDALRILSERTVTLLISDYRLPDGNGLDVIRAARATSQPPPTILVTGCSSAALWQDALAAGVVGYVVKPFSLSTFIAAIRGIDDRRLRARDTQ